MKGWRSNCEADVAVIIYTPARVIIYTSSPQVVGTSQVIDKLRTHMGCSELYHRMKGFERTSFHC